MLKVCIGTTSLLLPDTNFALVYQKRKTSASIAAAAVVLMNLVFLEFVMSVMVTTKNELFVGLQ